MRQLLRLNLFDLVDWHDENFIELRSLLSPSDFIHLILIGVINSDLLDLPDTLKEIVLTALYYRCNVNVSEDFENKLFNYILKRVNMIHRGIVINVNYDSEFEYLIKDDSIYIYIGNK